MLQHVYRSVFLTFHLEIIFCNLFKGLFEINCVNLLAKHILKIRHRMYVVFSVVMLIMIFIIYVINICLIYLNVALTGQSGQFDSPCI